MSEPSIRERVILKGLRAISRSWRAHTDLFHEPYRTWMPWKSGLGNAVRILYDLARMQRPATIVEIGSARGYSTCAFALACAENAKGQVVAIDPHESNEWTDAGTGGRTLEFLRARLRDYHLEDRCEVIASRSDVAARTWSRPIDLLFIDGDHSFAGVKTDFELFSPFVKEDGLILFHDASWEHQRPWASFAKEAFYREDMGVPAYLDGLQKAGFASVTLLPNPGLTIMHSRRGGFEFLCYPSARNKLRPIPPERT